MTNNLINDKMRRDLKVEKNKHKVWIFNLNEYSIFKEQLYHFLSDDEKKKSHSITKESIRILYIIRKGILRNVLAQELHMQPNTIKILYDEKGKPYLSEYAIEFNLSHSGDFFMIGISSDRKIGVDIQKIKKLKKGIPTLLFSEQERKRYQMLDDTKKSSFFWKTFVWKEAVSKAVGDGMTVNFCEMDRTIEEAKEGKGVLIHYTPQSYLDVEMYIDMNYKYAYSYVLLNNLRKDKGYGKHH